jgi:predicted RNase H-like nuclease (RuvC/YqgF family)
VNNKIDILNNYIKEVNKQKSLDKNEYNRVQEYVKKERSKIDLDLKEQRKAQSNLTKTLNQYNQKVFSYNNLSREINTLVSQIETMTRSVKKINGRTFGLQEITLKTIYKDGKMVQEKSVQTDMDKIEIYSFDSLAQLKVVIAHEILHLVGIPHIEESSALMNPLLQKNQMERLYLTNEDIENFRKNF